MILSDPSGYSMTIASQCFAQESGCVMFVYEINQCAGMIHLGTEEIWENSLTYSASAQCHILNYANR